MSGGSARKSIALSFYTFLSRILGLIRDHFMATSFGTGWVASAFSVAYRLPNMYRNLLAEGTLSQSFMPLYSDSGKISEEEAKLMSGVVLTFLFFLLTCFVAIFLLLAPWFIPILVGGSKEYSNLVIELSLILFVLIMTASLASIYMAIANSRQKFFVPSLSPIILNLSYLFVFIIIFPFYTDLLLKVKVLAYGIVSGGVIQLLVQALYVRKLGLFPKLNFHWRHPVIKKIFRLMVPAVIGGGFYQIGLLVDIFLANYIQNQNPGLGAVVSLDYSQRLIQFPTGIIGVALATTTLPALLASLKNNEKEKIPAELESVFSFALYLTIPAAIGLALLGRTVIDSIYFGGKWDRLATDTTVLSLMFYSIGIPAFSVNKILISSYYAFKDTKTPLKINFIAFIINLSLNLIFMQTLKHAGLALASALSANLISILLLINFKKHNIPIPILEILKRIIKFIPAILALSVWCIFCQIYIYDIFIEKLSHEFSHANSSRIFLVAGLVPGIIIYFLVSWISKTEEFQIIFGKIIQKIKRK